MEGFVDLHLHGFGRHDTRSGSSAAILKVAEAIWKKGTAAFLPTIYPGPIPAMRQQIKAVQEAMELQQEAATARCSARILGAHLEGPFLNPAFSGALDRRRFLAPSLTAVKGLMKGFETVVRIVTLSPELPGSLPVVRWCAERGVRVNMGHSDATLRQARAGKHAGARGITHLLNAMRPFHHREPGLVGLGLLDDELYVEVIADGVHLHPRTLELIFRSKRMDRIIVVSDAVAGSGGRRGAVYGRDGRLAGGSSTPARAVAVLKQAGVPDAEIAEATRDNPLRYLGIR